MLYIDEFDSIEVVTHSNSLHSNEFLCWVHRHIEKIAWW